VSRAAQTRCASSANAANWNSSSGLSTLTHGSGALSPGKNSDSDQNNASTISADADSSLR
jgi:hypothetical protein